MLPFAEPFRWLIGRTLLVIVAQTALMLPPPTRRDLNYNGIWTGDGNPLVLWAPLLPIIPILKGALIGAKRRMSAQVCGGVVHDLRMARYPSLQRMSLRVFIDTEVLQPSRALNDDVVGFALGHHQTSDRLRLRVCRCGHLYPR